MDRKSFMRGTLVGVLAMCLIFGAVFSGIKLFERFYAKSQGIEHAAATGAELDEKTKSKLGVISNLVDHYYLYEDEIDHNKQKEGVYEGFVASLGDPYSCYYDKEETMELRERTTGEYCGIGAVLQEEKGGEMVHIINVYKNSPAEKAGLKKDDLIYEVDGKDVAGIDLNEVVSWIRGEKGTEVTLSIYREKQNGSYAENEITVTRDVVEIQTVESKMLDGKIGYIYVSEFDNVTYEQYKESLTKLNDAGAAGMIVDLRDNPGGNLETVCEMLDLMLPEGTVVYTEDKNGKREDYTSDEEHKYDKPVCVLVNGNSASASEIFAGAMQDYKAGKIVGKTTYGKGIVQQIIDLKDGTSLKLTVSEYHTPNGRSIHKKGITPDIEVEQGEEDVFADPQNDAVLKRAIEELK